MSNQISDTEQAQRTAELARIRQSTEMEGGRSSDEARADQDAWVRGEITADELVARTIAQNVRVEPRAAVPSL